MLLCPIISHVEVGWHGQKCRGVRGGEGTEHSQGRAVQGSVGQGRVGQGPWGNSGLCLCCCWTRLNCWQVLHSMCVESFILLGTEIQDTLSGVLHPGR